MLIGLNQSLITGAQIDLTLNFSDGSAQTLNVEIKDVMSAMGNKHHPWRARPQRERFD